MNRTLDAVIARLAAPQYGVFSRTQARNVGFTDGQIDHRIVTGRWIALSPEALAIAGTPWSFERQLAAATLSIPGAVASHEAAAQLWRMIGVPRDRVVVTIPLGGNHRLGIGRVTESTDLKPRDITLVGGIRATTRERTLCDLGRVLSVARLGRTFNHELLRQNVSLSSTYQVFYRYARRGRRGITKVRTVLEQRGPGFAVPESELEERTIEVIRAAGLPMPEGQVNLTFWDNLVGRVDFVYRDARVVIEVDGLLWHGPDVQESDRERDNAATLAGWTVLRFTWKMVTQRPEYIVDSITTALHQARALAES